MFTLDADTDDFNIIEIQKRIDWAILEQMFEDDSDLIEQLLSTGTAKGVVNIDGVDVEYTMIVDDEPEFDFPDFPPDC